MSEKCATLKKAKTVATEGDTMDDMESYLILKYGNLHKAFNMWMNTYQTMPPELHNAINEFFWTRKEYGTNKAQFSD